jgi:hypothetical protein
MFPISLSMDRPIQQEQVGNLFPATPQPVFPLDKIPEIEYITDVPEHIDFLSSWTGLTLPARLEDKDA